MGWPRPQEARFATEALGAEASGVSHHRLKPSRRQPFAHRHDRAEELYLVLAGSGRVRLDDDIVEISLLHAIRVTPQVTRAFAASPEGLELIAFGARHDGDGEIIEGWWVG